MRTTAATFSTPSARTVATPHDVIGAAIGFALPLVAALLYRTYGIAVTPMPLEMTRQLGLPFVFAEVAIIMWARRAGYAPVAVALGMERVPRALLLLFLGTFWISSLVVSQDRAFSTTLNAIWIVHLLFGGAVFHLVRGIRGLDGARFACWFVAGLGALAVWTAVHFGFPPPGLNVPYGMEGWGGAVPGFISHRLFGAWAGAAAVLLLGLLWQRPAGDRRSWLLPAFTLAIGLALWTGTRAALLALMIGAAAALMMAGRPRTWRIYWQVPAALLIAAVLATVLNPYGDPSFMLYRPAGAYSTANAASSGRLEYWLAALDVAMQRPLFGSGAGSCWWLVQGPDVNHVQPHNALIQFFLSWGLVPTVPLVGLLGIAAVRVHRIARQVPSIVPLVMMLDALLAMSMVDGMLYFARFLMLVAALFAVCLAAGGGVPARSSSRASSLRLRSSP